MIGRQFERTRLKKLFDSTEAEFMVVYGRRRVGKTFLIQSYFTEEQDCVFMQATGLQKGSLKQQLQLFTDALAKTFFRGAMITPPKDWGSAFKLLTQQLEMTTQTVVIFLDEFPWMVTPRAGLLEMLDHYWNQYWSRLKHIRLVICGSSASWLIKKIIENKGGLHNRVTSQLHLKPFTLSETAAFLKHRKIKLNASHCLSLYLALGGVPYYLKYVEPGLTAEQNIQRILFDQDAPLHHEFEKLFYSLFKHADAYIELIKVIGMRKEGLDRVSLQKHTKISNGGRLSERLKDLVLTGFIQTYSQLGKTQNIYYKLIDEFSLFYFQWVMPHRNQLFVGEHWLSQHQKPAYASWAGYAFEAVCMQHIDQVVKALGIHGGGVISSWRYIPKTSKECGAQIDLLIERNDNAITLCEIKYTREPFVIDKNYALILQRKIDLFNEKTKNKKQVFLALISAHGVKKNKYSELLIDQVVTLEHLFIG
ncbi:MAG: ATPase AAA [marine bacterium B5-7]|nr:MAG: ATPase AAA [marine bacterium B5-7]